MDILIRCSIFTVMKKALYTSAVLVLTVALMQSCAPNRKLPRPQRHPTPPKKFVQNTPVAQPQAATMKDA